MTAADTTPPQARAADHLKRDRRPVPRPTGRQLHLGRLFNENGDGVSAIPDAFMPIRTAAPVSRSREIPERGGYFT